MPFDNGLSLHWGYRSGVGLPLIRYAVEFIQLKHRVASICHVELIWILFGDDRFSGHHDETERDDAAGVDLGAEHEGAVLGDALALDVDVCEDNGEGGGGDEDAESGLSGGRTSSGAGCEDCCGYFGDEEEGYAEVAVDTVEEEVFVADDGGELQL